MYCHAVKLLRINKQGKLITRSKTFGLLEVVLGSPDIHSGHQEIVPHMVVTNKNPKNLGKQYGGFVSEAYEDPSRIPISFKTPFQIIPAINEKGLLFYFADNFPSDYRVDFIQGMLEAAKNTNEFD